MMMYRVFQRVTTYIAILSGMVRRRWGIMEEGQSLVEYAILISVVGIALIGIAPRLQEAFELYFRRVATVIAFPTP